MKTSEDCRQRSTFTEYQVELPDCSQLRQKYKREKLLLTKKVITIGMFRSRTEAFKSASITTNINNIEGFFLIVPIFYLRAPYH